MLKALAEVKQPGGFWRLAISSCAPPESCAMHWVV